MRNLKRTVLVAGAMFGIATPPPADATANQPANSIKTTQRITTLSSSPQSLTNVGTSDGKIARATVHGALRAIATFTTPSTFTAAGTLFYQPGTLRYTLHGTATANPDGSLTISGRGTFTGGTGTYFGARGRFTVSGTKPANSYETWSLSGNVRYR